LKEVEMKMMDKSIKILTAAAIGLAMVGAVSQASAQSAPRRHSGYIERSYQRSQGDTQFPDHSNTGLATAAAGVQVPPRNAES
jgi:hypothetical protein